jgi:hypothetical protein
MGISLRRYTEIGLLIGPGRRHAEAGVPHHGSAVQVDPIKSTFKAPATKRLKLKRDALLSDFAFKFNLRRYIMAPAGSGGAPCEVDAFETQFQRCNMAACTLPKM